MKTKNTIFLFFSLLAIIILLGCSSEKQPLKVLNEPTQKIISELKGQDFSIVLNDMDVTEDEKNIIYRHKYVILKPKQERLDVDSTDWQNVSEEFFMKHENDLGMEIVSNHDGKFSAIAKPVGFDWAVGNKKYGDWQIDSTSTNHQKRHWVYRNSSSFFLMYWMFSRPTPMRVYNNYANSARGRTPYYGMGNNIYGTKSQYNKVKRSNFYKRRATSSTWGKTYSKRKVTRSSSRFGGSSRTRGRSGGFGK